MSPRNHSRKGLPGHVSSNTKGVYTLLMSLDQDKSIQVGKLGGILFRHGHYAYTGSALGSGGFSRVARHLRVASGENRTRKWHIDYLLPEVEVVMAVLSVTERRIECDIASRIQEKAEPVAGFGCTDCRCRAHLHFMAELKELREIVEWAHGHREL